MTHGHASFLPTSRQELLIGAAVLAGEAAIAAWQEWSRGAHEQPLDSGSQRLLPLVHRNLVPHGVDDPRLHEAYIRSREYNGRLFAAAQPLLRDLANAGVRTMLLKGAALNRLVYPDAARPMHDIDILVPRAQAPTAVAVAAQSGWTATPPLNRLDDALFARHAWHFRSRDGLALDLHWRMYFDSARSDDADAEVWSSATGDSLADGTPSALPAAADLLFHVCVHGARWSNVSPIRWITDALALVNSEAVAIEWERVLHQAELRRLALPLRAAIDYLCTRWDVAVPSHVRNRLHGWRASRLERAEYDLWMRGSPALGAARMALFHGLHYARLSEGSRLTRRLAGFPRYLSQVWGVDSGRGLARAGFTRWVARLRRQ